MEILDVCEDLHDYDKEEGCDMITLHCPHFVVLLCLKADMSLCSFSIQASVLLTLPPSKENIRCYQEKAGNTCISLHCTLLYAVLKNMK